MNLVDRAKNMIVTPKTEWNAVAAEEPNTGQILTGYVLPMALIPTIAAFVGYSFIGIGFWGRSMTFGIVQALIIIINAFLSVLITSFVIDALAGSFGSQKSMGRAMQLVAYSMTPVWVFGILNIFPVIGWLGNLLGLYGLYLMYLGLTPTMKTPEDKKIGYLLVSIIILIVVYFVIAAILGAILFSIFGLTLLSGLTSPM